MSERQRLPNRRANESRTFEVGGLLYTATISRYADGRVGEIFIQNHKADSAAGIMASDAAIAASLALQFGCPFETLRQALCRDARGKATGPLGAALDLLLDGNAGDDRWPSRD
jgi:ribonucleoside-diphosphate reductase alpha chain